MRITQFHTAEWPRLRWCLSNIAHIEPTATTASTAEVVFSKRRREAERDPGSSLTRARVLFIRTGCERE